ncbi:hypothetical protein ACM66B_003576 [Microbotryomycetes sp. NB124-2]
MPPVADSDELMPLSSSQRRRRHLVGLGLTLLVVVLWVTSSFLMNSLFTSMTYNKPFLITYICTATFSLYLVRPAIVAWRDRRRRTTAVANGNRPQNMFRTASGVEPLGTFTDANGVVYMRPEFSYRTRSHSRSMSRGRPASVASGRASAPVIVTEAPLTVRQTAAVALMFCALWFFANWSMNASLAYTSVSSTTILSSMSGLFTLAVGSCVGVETVTVHKAASVVLSIFGVFLISRGDAGAPASNGVPSNGDDVIFAATATAAAAPKAVLGDLLALLSALAYAVYVVLLKVRIKTEARVSMTLFFGFVGLFNILLIWPAGFVLHFLAIETWEWPRGGRLWLNIGLNAMITFVSDAIYVRAMLMTSPLAVTLGISLTIPLALAGDLYRGTSLSWQVVLGGALVLGSFVANGLLDYRIAAKGGPPLKVVEFDEAIEEERETLLSDE